MEELVKAVQKYAIDNWGKGGWDYIHECWEDKEIAEYLTEYKAATVEEAITEMGKAAALWDERRREVMNEIF